MNTVCDVLNVLVWKTPQPEGEPSLPDFAAARIWAELDQAGLPCASEILWCVRGSRFVPVGTAGAVDRQTLSRLLSQAFAE